MDDQHSSPPLPPLPPPGTAVREYIAELQKSAEPPALPPMPPTHWPQVRTRNLPEYPDVDWREFCAIILLVMLADLTIFNGKGYCGYAILLAVAPVLIWLGACKRRLNWQTTVVTLMAWGAAVRLVWCGNGLAFFLGLVLLAGVSLSLAGGTVYLLDILRFLGMLLPSGVSGFVIYDHWLKRTCRRWITLPSRTRLLAYVLPPVVGLMFLTIFILANPDVVHWVSQGLTDLVETLQKWLASLVSPVRFLFWGAMAWLAIGLLRPLLPSTEPTASERNGDDIPLAKSDLYPAFRNTIFVVIALFGGYLAFEFWTMGHRTFPPKFHYSGYAHQGAAWLTIALGLATLVLSVIFRGHMLRDPRLAFLRNLAMVWAMENLLLALAVYNRLFIYVGFNGMTRMRVVGLLGISTVVIGFVLVVIKIWRGHNFAWVIRHQLVALAVAFYLYAVLPVDHWVMAYNVRQIMAGHLAPSVQIGHHPTSIEGKLELIPLLECSDPIIREGVAAILHETHDALRTRDPVHWTAYQAADFRLQKQLGGSPAAMQNFTSESEKRFREYTYQWY